MPNCKQDRSVSGVQTTVIGLERMGRALATALGARGHDTTVWNRTPGELCDVAVTSSRTNRTSAPGIPTTSTAGIMAIPSMIGTPSAVVLYSGIELPS